MKKYVAFLLMVICIFIGLYACVNDEAKFDYSQCDESIDFHYKEGKPWVMKEKFVGSIAGFSSFYDTTADGYLLGAHQSFFCNYNRDTCWYHKTDTTRFRGDTINFGNECGLEEVCGPIVVCQLDANHSLSVDIWTLDVYDAIPIDPTLMLDTNSNPATRSAYKIWWPLPRTPWPKGESVAADSLVWADSI